MDRTHKVGCALRNRTFVEKIIAKKDKNFVIHFRLLITARGTGLSVFKNKIVSLSAPNVKSLSIFPSDRTVCDYKVITETKK